MLHPVGLVVFGDYVYWIDRESRNVMKIKKQGEIHGSTVQAAIDDLSDMIVVDTRKASGRDHCLVLNLTINIHILLAGIHIFLIVQVGRILSLQTMLIIASQEKIILQPFCGTVNDLCQSHLNCFQIKVNLKIIDY